MHRTAIFSLLFILATDSYKVLVYNPKCGHSHSAFLGGIADVLTEAGHEVTSLVSIIDPQLHDGTTLSKVIHVEQSDATKKQFEELMRAKREMFTFSSYSPFDNHRLGNVFGRLFAAQCAALLEDNGLMERLKAKKFDVFITETFDICGVGLVPLLQPRSLIIAASSPTVGVQQGEFGAPTGISHQPVIHVSKMDVHSMWHRTRNLYLDAVTALQFRPMRSHIQELFRAKFGSDFPSFEHVISNSAYIFMNTEPLVDFASPTLNKIVYIAGIAANEPKQLNENWERILTKRDKTVLISFGSVVLSSALPTAIKTSIVKANITAQSLPQVTFVWKYEVDDDFKRNVASKIDNIELIKWMPQFDILHHPRIAAFITHGGMGSTQECALAAVPCVFMPIFADQPRNAGMMAHNKLCTILSKSDAEEPAKLLSAVREVLEDDSNRRNVRRISAMLRRKPFSSRELLIKYTEFAAEFGPSTALRPQSHDMSVVAYHNLDLFATGLFVFIFVSIAACKLLSSATSRAKRAIKTKCE